MSKNFVVTILMIELGIIYFYLFFSLAILFFLPIMLKILLEASIFSKLKPAFINTLFPVTCPNHIYSTALVIMITLNT